MKSYEETSTSTKKRRINQILEEIPATDILNACLKKAGTTSEIETNDVDNCENQSNDNSNTNNSNILSDYEALALYIDAKLTKTQYTVIRERLLTKNVYILPEYRHIIAAKARCYPEVEVSENGASIKLHDLLDHTAQRILETDEEKNLFLKNKRSV